MVDGDYITNEIAAVHASDVTIAHITIREAVHHPVTRRQGAAPSPIRRALIDGGSQFLKVNAGRLAPFIRRRQGSRQGRGPISAPTSTGDSSGTQGTRLNQRVDRIPAAARRTRAAPANAAVTSRRSSTKPMLEPRLS